MEDRCVFCGEIVPEGRLVCRRCEIAISRIETDQDGLYSVTCPECKERYTIYSKKNKTNLLSLLKKDLKRCPSCGKEMF